VMVDLIFIVLVGGVEKLMGYLLGRRVKY
jgi:hypothetical protein